MKKYKIKNKKFDGLIVTSPRLTNKYSYEFYSRNMVGWQRDVSRYFIGWFPVLNPFLIENEFIFCEEYNIKIIKNYESL